MSKRELVKTAIRHIRRELSIMHDYSNEGNMEMYSHMWKTVSARVDFLYDMGIITTNQYSRLFDIVHEM